jgi:demethylmenaquinone methyltransferase/2-methoxy-6-polyprenyl-1,4-benzoquinol methylase
MSEQAQVIQRLLEANPLREPVLRQVIRSLCLPPGSRGLDIGCGIGSQALLLADAVGADGQVSGVDIAPELVAYGNEAIRQAGYGRRVSLHKGDASHLPFEDHSLDWAWSADCVGYPMGELDPFLKEMIRVVKPGGSVFLLAWSSQQLLPGYPFLEARLNATCSAYLPYLKDQDSRLHFMRALQSFQRLGLAQVQARTFVRDIQAPLSSGERAALVSLFDMVWGQPQPDVSGEDWREFQRLCQPGSPDFIVDLPEYYAFFTYTLFQAGVSG